MQIARRYVEWDYFNSEYDICARFVLSIRRNNEMAGNKLVFKLRNKLTTDGGIFNEYGLLLFY